MTNEKETKKFLEENIELIEEFLCPSDINLIDYITENLDKSVQERLEKHISKCNDCKKTIEELRKASEWFDSNRDMILDDLEQKATSKGLLPWYGFHLPDYLLLSYLEGKIPDDQKGKKVIEDIETHLKQCDVCQKKLQKYKNIRWTIINLANIQKNTNQFQLLQNIVLKLQRIALAHIRQKRASMIMRERSRSIEEKQIRAKVVYENKNLCLDEEGKPIIIEFDVINASIDDTGLLKIELKVRDQNYWKQAEKEYELEAEIEYENIKILLPRESISKEGKVTITSDLKMSEISLFIPLKNINISVISK